MNISEIFFKDVFEYEYGCIDDELKNDELFSLSTKLPNFWENVEKITSKKHYHKLYYLSAKYLMKDNILSEDEYHFLKRLREVIKASQYEIYREYKTEIDRLIYEIFYLMYLDAELDNSEEKEMQYLTEIFGVEYMAMCDIKRKVLNDKYQQTIEKEMQRNRHIPERILITVFERDKGRCVLCGSTDSIEYDHIIPFSKGGSNDSENIRVLCRKCNRKKSNNIGLI
ncbi:MAG: hypothetical protein CVU05_09310 [Bacteroidetes bacterium HGW-Bacteroidetes-21]|jgi:5-methylcytosine-specific restriction endonuclease McrA|nr:MAG: hypothetical protein CVU05_09310 [Bacteroidetes bacterium HGW-Bacteroidetes-21]